MTDSSDRHARTGIRTLSINEQWGLLEINGDYN